MKKISIITGIVLVIAICIGIGMSIVYNFIGNRLVDMVGATEGKPVISEKRVLTDDQQKLVGFWESEEGCVLAIRPRKMQPSDYDNFPLDAIFTYPNMASDIKECDRWLKFTREDGSKVEKIDGVITFCDTHDCPTSGDMNRYVVTEYRAEYIEETDTIYFQDFYDNELFEAYTLNRTDKSIDEAYWDFYYDIHENRDPR